MNWKKLPIAICRLSANSTDVFIVNTSYLNQLFVRHSEWKDDWKLRLVSIRNGGETNRQMFLSANISNDNLLDNKWTTPNDNNRVLNSLVFFFYVVLWSAWE